MRLYALLLVGLLASTCLGARSIKVDFPFCTYTYSLSTTTSYCQTYITLNNSSGVTQTISVDVDGTGFGMLRNFVNGPSWDFSAAWSCSNAVPPPGGTTYSDIWRHCDVKPAYRTFAPGQSRTFLMIYTNLGYNAGDQYLPAGVTATISIAENTGYITGSLRQVNAGIVLVNPILGGQAF